MSNPLNLTSSAEGRPTNNMAQFHNSDRQESFYEKHRAPSLPRPSISRDETIYKPAITPYAGRLGGNQDFVLDRNDPNNADTLEKLPDAAPYMTLRQSFDLRGFRDPTLWKVASIEGIGTMMLVYITVWIALHPEATPTPPQTPAGVFATSAFFGPLIGGITNWIIIALFIYSFSSVSGGHFNPTITIATFFARLTSFPRMILYVGFQTAGAALAGLALRASYGSRSYLVGGCAVDTQLVEVKEAFVLEFMFTMTLIFIAFGVGLDPRQATIFGPALAPGLVGMTLGVLSFGSGYTRLGFSGASMNPARCFGAFVGSSFPGYHWIHWIGPITASIGHGIVYMLAPPWIGKCDKD